MTTENHSPVKASQKESPSPSINYASLGFKAGLEIHQQLATRKLFCYCPSLVHGTKTDFVIRRKMRAAAGETGEFDSAARHEMAQQKSIIYTGDRETVCLVELDEEPPKPLSQEALAVALQVAKLLNAQIVDEIQVMRKTIVDGSNVSAFQRTLLIAVDGFIETNQGRVGIPTICLEEEAAQKISFPEAELHNERHYNLDRLGIPLIEIATDASLKDSQHVHDVAKKMGMILRSTGNLIRGIGSIRQDVNVSIAGHPRVEIKGFQDIRSMQKTIENEVKRQQDEVKARTNHPDKKRNQEIAAHVRKANADGTTSYLRPMPGYKRMYPETDIPPIIPNIDAIKIPVLIEDTVEELIDNGLSTDLAAFVVKLGKAELVKKIAEQYPSLKMSSIAESITGTLRELQRESAQDSGESKESTHLHDAAAITIFAWLAKEEIGKEGVAPLLKSASRGEDILKEKEKYVCIDDTALVKSIEEIIKKNAAAPTNALIGIVMKELRGKADGKKIVALVQKVASNHQKK